MSNDKGFHFLDVYWALNENLHYFKDGLHLNGEGAGICFTSVSIATQTHFWTKRSQPSLSGNGKGLPPQMGAP